MDHRAVGIDEWRALIAADPAAAAERARDVARGSAGDLGAFLAVAEPGAPPSRAGRLAGVPFAVKDNIDTRSLPTTGGSAVLDGSVPRADAGVVRRLVGEGARIVGKTNLHELALGVTSENASFGDVRSPIDSERSAGGSSGGSAVAVAVGAAAFALGTDTGGSMTIPASCCGVVGFRPTRGRYPLDGLLSISWTRDSIGVLAGSVADVLDVDAAVTRVRRPGHRHGPLRLGVPRNRLCDLDDDVAAVAVGAYSALEGSGLVELHEVSTGDLDQRAFEHGLSLVTFEAPRTVEMYLSGLRPPYNRLDLGAVVSGTRSVDVRTLLDLLLADPTGRDRYRRALDARDAVRAGYRRLFHAERLDALVYPTLPARPPLIGLGGVLHHRGRSVEVFPTLTRHTEPGAFAGNPSISLPAGPDSGGLPVGLTVEGLPDTDDGLLRVATTVEAVLAGHDVPVPAGEGSGS